MILLAEHDEPTILAAKKKRQPGASSWPTSTPKNRVWGFENTASGRPSVEPQLTQETATGSVQYTYQIASGRAKWLSRDPFPNAEMSLGPNLYTYVTNDPIKYTDPLGLCGGRGGNQTPCPPGTHSAIVWDDDKFNQTAGTMTGGTGGVLWAGVAGVAGTVVVITPPTAAALAGYGALVALESTLSGFRVECVPN